MTILVSEDGIQGNLAFAIGRLENLLADLQQLEDGNLPPKQNILDAPLIDRWSQGVRASQCLVGKVTGHPYLSGNLSATSDLWIFAPELGWARTLSRFYRLGQQRGQGGQP